MSRLALAKNTPVAPPVVNRNINPSVYNKGVVNLRVPPYNEANHEKILTPVGTAIIIVAAVKYARLSASIPTIYI
jgi:hypothetical protein